MIQHVVEKARSVADDVYVATDDSRIYEKVEAFGGQAIMTSSEHRSGTDRCFEAYEKVVEKKRAEYDVVVNVQGDEPFIEPQQIRQLIGCFENPAIQIATLAKPFEDAEALFDPNKVKVVFSSQNTAIYFSRSPIPFARGVEKTDWLNAASYYKHVGMYAYRPAVLKEITRLPVGKLEKDGR